MSMTDESISGYSPAASAQYDVSAESRIHYSAATDERKKRIPPPFSYHMRKYGLLTLINDEGNVRIPLDRSLSRSERT